MKKVVYTDGCHKCRNRSCFVLSWCGIETRTASQHPYAMCGEKGRICSASHCLREEHNLLDRPQNALLGILVDGEDRIVNRDRCKPTTSNNERTDKRP